MGASTSQPASPLVGGSAPTAALTRAGPPARGTPRYRLLLCGAPRSGKSALTFHVAHRAGLLTQREVDAAGVLLAPAAVVWTLRYLCAVAHHPPVHRAVPRAATFAGRDVPADPLLHCAMQLLAALPDGSAGSAEGGVEPVPSQPHPFAGTAGDLALAAPGTAAADPQVLHAQRVVTRWLVAPAAPRLAPLLYPPTPPDSASAARATAAMAAAEERLFGVAVVHRLEYDLGHTMVRPGNRPGLSRRDVEALIVGDALTSGGGSATPVRNGVAQLSRECQRLVCDYFWVDFASLLHALWTHPTEALPALYARRYAALDRRDATGPHAFTHLPFGADAGVWRAWMARVGRGELGSGQWVPTARDAVQCGPHLTPALLERLIASGNAADAAAAAAAASKPAPQRVTATTTATVKVSSASGPVVVSSHRLAIAPPPDMAARRKAGGVRARALVRETRRARDALADEDEEGGAAALLDVERLFPADAAAAWAADDAFARTSPAAAQAVAASRVATATDATGDTKQTAAAAVAPVPATSAAPTAAAAPAATAAAPVPAPVWVKLTDVQTSGSTTHWRVREQALASLGTAHAVVFTAALGGWDGALPPWSTPRADRGSLASSALSASWMALWRLSHVALAPRDRHTPPTPIVVLFTGRDRLWHDARRWVVRGRADRARERELQAVAAAAAVAATRVSGAGASNSVVAATDNAHADNAEDDDDNNDDGDRRIGTDTAWLWACWHDVGDGVIEQLSAPHTARATKAAAVATASAIDPIGVRWRLNTVSARAVHLCPRAPRTAHEHEQARAQRARAHERAAAVHQALAERRVPPRVPQDTGGLCGGTPFDATDYVTPLAPVEQWPLRYHPCTGDTELSLDEEVDRVVAVTERALYRVYRQALSPAHCAYYDRFGFRAINSCAIPTDPPPPPATSASAAPAPLPAASALPTASATTSATAATAATPYDADMAALGTPSAAVPSAAGCGGAGVDVWEAMSEIVGWLRVWNPTYAVGDYRSDAPDE